MTSEGEVIGLFLTRPVRAGLAPREAAVEIKSQGGLVYLEHPYDLARRRMSESGIESLADLIDIVEVFNGRSDARANRLAEELRATLGTARGAGSDAHSLNEIGSVYVEMEEFGEAGDFLAKLQQSTIVRNRSRLLLATSALLRHAPRQQ
jgi:predicted metal-dependent phosphoesterase TrpH